jgi:hypothetical protein
MNPDPSEYEAVTVRWRDGNEGTKVIKGRKKVGRRMTIGRTN